MGSLREATFTLASENTRSSLLKPKGDSGSQRVGWKPGLLTASLLHLLCPIRMITVARPVLLRCSQEGLLGHPAVLRLTLTISNLLQPLRGSVKPTTLSLPPF